ncbi:saccharopine dehydrogenase-like protein [Stackebrandtia endophytica]|uniref:Saccharopine dehydrogenase-like protein n=1 Tax=Stackebrandtia endophytica TaxID=1496996 RepID=A0A543B4G7_9ACTN|nr:saccharopine dehydrogenase NADP-binding domain-containing protein [Stackebrandtia endophytica]TQL79714.1 saccharopine dehydrogenase-like protein [Stackebrandtia endophytica]
MNNNVLVYGAYGHTGRFVVAELLRHGLTPILSGRDATALKKLHREYPTLETRPATIDDTEALRVATDRVAAVVNCAGPFLDTGLPVAEAAERAGAHYLDVTAEQGAVQQIYRAHDRLGHPTEVATLPAMAFYGGLPDLMATAVAKPGEAIDEITVAIGLDRWWPTEGTRKTGQRNTIPRLVVTDGQPAPATTSVRQWSFPAPLGTHTMVECPFSEVITMSRHLDAANIRTYLSQRALTDIRDSATSAPAAVDSTGRSAQLFTVEVAVRQGTRRRRITATGRDIYAVTAPLVVEATRRLLDGRAVLRGAAAPGETFDAADFLSALDPDTLSVGNIVEESAG